MKLKRFATVLLTACVIWFTTREAQAFYNPSTGRWLNRDPIEENGSANLAAFVGNDAIGRFDILGQSYGDYRFSLSESRHSIVFGLALALSGLILVSCGRFEKSPTELIHRNEVETTFLNLAADLPLLGVGGAITSIVQVKLDWSLHAPQSPPLFKTYEPDSVRGVYPAFYLPARDYFWLNNWTTNDPPRTPLFWSYFNIPGWNPPDDVVYLTIGRTVHHCPSNDFYQMVAPLSNRVERAQTGPVSNVGGPNPKN